MIHINLNSSFPDGAVRITMHKQRSKDQPFHVIPIGPLDKRQYDVVFDVSQPVGEQAESLRRAAFEVYRLAKDEKRSALHLDAANMDAQSIWAFADGLVLADYRFDCYKKKKDHHIDTLSIASDKLKERTLDEYRSLWNYIACCRDWVNMPPADLNSELFAQALVECYDTVAAKVADRTTRCTVLGQDDLERLKMGGLLAVNRGSMHDAQMVVLEYDGSRGKQAHPIALVGKGITYDTGGLNLKPDDYMQEMKSDMAGAATMASVYFAAVENRLPIHLVAVLPLTDNRPGFDAYAADDILRMYDGTTVEVVNTDAEGRLILADALAYTLRTYKPELMIDAATLTGAAVRAISTFGIAAIQQNAEKQTLLMQTIGEAVHQRLALLPFWKEYDELLHSDVADMKNCGPAQAGTITAGKFLAHFVGKCPYIHLDIAGVAFFSKPQPPYASGASGYGIRLLYEFLKNYKS